MARKRKLTLDMYKNIMEAMENAKNKDWIGENS